MPAASREQGIDRIARRRREHDVGGRKRARSSPAPARRLEAVRRASAPSPVEAVDCSRQVRKRVEVPALCEMTPVENRRKAHRPLARSAAPIWPMKRSIRSSVSSNSPPQPIHARDAGRDQEPRAQQLITQACHRRLPRADCVDGIVTLPCAPAASLRLPHTRGRCDHERRAMRVAQVAADGDTASRCDSRRCRTRPERARQSPAPSATPTPSGCSSAGQSRRC